MMEKALITSRSNPLIKRIRALDQRKYREQEGVFFVEGIQPVLQALQSGAEIETVVVAPDLLTSDTAYSTLQQHRASTVSTLSKKVFESIAEREHPSGLAAIVRMPRRTLEDLSITPASFFVALEVSNPGNLGTIIRTADGVGASGTVLIGDSTDPYHPTAVKASRGALFSVPIVQVKKPDTLFGWCERHSTTIVTTSPRAPTVYWSATYHRPALFLFGREGTGLPEQALGQGTLSVNIPMSGAVDSLNLAVSVGILLYEAKRQWEGERGMRDEG